jgi:hypothetical protein
LSAKPKSLIWEEKINIGLAHLQPILSLLAGAFILIILHLLNYIVANFLTVTGISDPGLFK